MMIWRRLMLLAFSAAMVIIPCRVCAVDGASVACARIRVLAAPGSEAALVGTVISYSDAVDLAATPANWRQTPITVLRNAPAPGTWAEVAMPVPVVHRVWTLQLPPQAVIAEMALQRADGSPLTGSFSATSNGGAIRGLSDNDPATSWRPEHNNDWSNDDMPRLAIDLGEAVQVAKPVIMADGGWDAAGPRKVTLRTTTPGAVIKYTLDGRQPSLDVGKVYTEPILLDAQPVTIAAQAMRDDLAPSVTTTATWIPDAAAKPGINCLLVGNSTIDPVMNSLPFAARNSGYRHRQTKYTSPGAPMWGLFLQDKGKNDWRAFTKIQQYTDVVLQLTNDHDSSIWEETEYGWRMASALRTNSPDAQTWLFPEWPFRSFQEARSQGQGSVKGLGLPPAGTWQEAVANRMAQAEAVAQTWQRLSWDGKPVRILPAAIAAALVRTRIEAGEAPGLDAGSFTGDHFRDGAHATDRGCYILGLGFTAALYGKEAVMAAAAAGTGLTEAQAEVYRAAAWESVRNYPPAGVYRPGPTPTLPPVVDPAPAPLTKPLRVKLSSPTPGAWVRYTLDGSTPSPTHGLLCFGPLTARPGMHIRAMAYGDGLAESDVVDITWPSSPGVAAWVAPKATWLPPVEVPGDQAWHPQGKVYARGDGPELRFDARPDGPFAGWISDGQIMLDGRELWISGVFQVTKPDQRLELSVMGNSAVAMGVRADVGYDTPKLVHADADPLSWVVGIGREPAPAMKVAGIDTPTRLVMHLDGRGMFLRADLYINPDPQQLPTVPDATVQRLARLRLTGIKVNGAGGTITQLRVGDSLAAVLP